MSVDLVTVDVSVTEKQTVSWTIVNYSEKAGTMISKDFTDTFGFNWKITMDDRNNNQCASLSLLLRSVDQTTPQPLVGSLEYNVCSANARCAIPVVAGHVSSKVLNFSLSINEEVVLENMHKHVDSYGYMRMVFTLGYRMQGAFHSPARANMYIIPLFNNKDNADIEIKLKSGATMPAHRMVLCDKSEMFRAILTEAIDAAQPEADRKNVDLSAYPDEISFLFVKYFYVGRVEMQVDSGMQLLEMALHFGVTLLAKECCVFLQDNLNMANFMQILAIVERFPTLSLHFAVNHFMKTHLDEIRTSPEFATVLQNLDPQYRGRFVSRLIALAQENK